MTIKKTYELQVDHHDGSIDHIERKGKTAEDALKHAEQEFPEASYISITGRKNDAKWRRLYMSLEDRPVFPHKSARFGEYVYLHKGRPAKGRKVQSSRRYGARRVVAVWVESYSAPVTKFLQDWIGLIAEDLPIQVPA
ncbi:hypothetical protein [Xanthomonas phage RTH11]|nr:hypothetical protein [Xanthomonas phage RTH11]